MTRPQIKDACVSGIDNVLKYIQYLENMVSQELDRNKELQIKYEDLLEEYNRLKEKYND